MAHLRASVAELGESGMEETVLLAEGLDVCSSIRNFSLERHIRVGDLRDLEQEISHAYNTDRSIRLTVAK